jgi:hypothetical protein
MAGTLNQAQIEEIRSRVGRVAEIELGALPTLEELYFGYPFARLSLGVDRRLWLASFALKLGKSDALTNVHSAIELAIADGDATIVRALRDVIEQHYDAGYLSELGVEALQRLDYYLAIEERGPERDRVLEETMPIGLVPARSVSTLYRLGLAVGLQLNKSNSPEQLALDGLELFKELGDFARLALASEQDAISNAPPARPLDVDLDPVEDIVEQVRQAGLFHPQLKGAVVIPPAPATAAKSGAARDVWKSVEVIAGKAVEIDDPADLVIARGVLTRRYPHLLSEIDIMLRAPQPLRLLLIGEPGAGKTAIAQSLADAFGLQWMMFSAAGVADSSFGGTSSQWNSARMSVPLQLIARSRVANPLLIIDEIDKADPDKRNGAFADALLPFLEPASARRVMDLGLEVEVDVSRVGYIATANDLSAVPAMLRDRFKIVCVPLPDPAFLPALSENVLTDIAAAREIDRRWLEPLAGDELDLIRQVWKSRSMRQLRRLIETIVAGRELLATRS